MGCSNREMSTEATNQKIDYAFEIRFVDDNIVQVFDIAAKRKQQNDENLLLPTEYKQEEVLKGQLRYSKLVGSSSSTIHPVAKDAFGLEDNGLPYEHIVTTKRSKNRTSTQRQTFFMMGGGDNGLINTVSDDRNDSGTVFTEMSDENLNHTTCNIQQDDVDHQNNSPPKSPKSPKSIQQKPLSVLQQQQQQQQQPVVIQEPPTINQSQPIHNPAPGTYHSDITIPTTQDYTSITTVTTNNSRNCMQQQQKQQQKQQPTKAAKRGCCCIIS